MNPNDLSELSVNKLRLYMCKFIRLANPGSFPKPHDLRKLATSYAFFRSMSIEELCNIVGWASIRVFRKHYMRNISELSSSVVVLGSVVSGSADTA